MEDKNEEKRVASLDRALAILAAFNEDHPCLSLAELSRRTGQYKSTVVRTLASLQEFGLVDQDGDGNYHVGAASTRLASLYQRSLNSHEILRAGLARLVAATQECANFYVRRGNVRVCILCVDSPRRIRAHTLVGDIFPLDRGAGGKILSAFSDDLASGPGLEDVRKTCLAISQGEFVDDLTGLAAPVFGMGDRLEGALAVTGPRSRLTGASATRAAVDLLGTARELTRALGGSTALLERALAKANAGVAGSGA